MKSELSSNTAFFFFFFPLEDVALTFQKLASHEQYGSINLALQNWSEESFAPTQSTAVCPT